ncbi:MAG: hypothetical protein HOP35_17575 [Nitrospira sp.]|nr:hypothetical protein [Nitrospira sp.]
MQKNKQSTIKGLFLPAIALCSLFVTGNVAQAALVSYSFTGGVSNVSRALKSTFPLSSTMSGSFQFYDATPSSGTGRYLGAVQNLSLKIGSYTVNLDPAGSTNVIRITDTPSGDLWRLRTSVTGASIGGFSPEHFRLDLADEDGGAITETTLKHPPSLGSLTSTHWRLVFKDIDGKTVRIQGALNSLTAVPLPAAVLLFGAGLISLVGLGAGGLRNLRGTRQA